MRIIDLSTPLYTGMDIYPGDPEVTIGVIHTHPVEGWELRKIVMGSHTGTHVDAYRHTDPEGRPIDDIPLERFFGPARLARIGEPLPVGTGLLFDGVIGISLRDEILASDPPFVGAGDIDIDLERVLLKAGIVTYTNLINLEQLPKNKSFMFYGFPLRISGGDGSPVRAVAIVE